MSKHWYTDGNLSRLIDDEIDSIPQGWYRGRGPKLSNSLSNAYALKSEEEKLKIIHKRMNTMNNKSEEEKQLYRQRLSDGSKGKNTGKEPWNKGLTKETDERVLRNSEHTAQSVKQKAEKIKEEDPEYFTRWRNSINDVMRRNNTFNTSKAEDVYYERLVDKFGKEDVVRWYSDERYPFACDFYVPSEDLFIEFNRTWTHGGHPFNPMNLDDIYTLEQWQEKAKTSKYYQNAVYTWTDLDVRKQAVAKENNLNYSVIY